MVATRKAGNVPPEVKDFFDAKGIRPAFSYLDVWREEHLAAFSVAKAIEGNVIEAMRAAVVKAINEGIPFERFKRDLAPILADAGWWGRKSQKDPLTGETKEVQLGSPSRLRLVYETNMRVARAAGQWQRIERTKKSLPLLQYRLGASEKHRPEHEALDGRIFPVDSPFWDFWMPTNGYNCKCWVLQLTDARGEELGFEDAPPPDWAMEMQEYTNPRTGATVSAPKGIDPGFAFNPGKNRLEGLRQTGILKIQAAPKKPLTREDIPQSKEKLSPDKSVIDAVWRQSKNREYTGAQKNSIKSYSGSVYENIVKAESGFGKKELSAKAKEVADKHVSNIYGAIKRGGGSEHTIYRGMRVAPDFVDKLLSSDTLKIDRLSSWSANPEVAIGFTRQQKKHASATDRVVFKIKTTKAAPISSLSKFPKEAELLLGKGDFTIADRKYVKLENGEKVLVIELEHSK